MSESADVYRPLGVPLALGIYAIPLIFYWLLLRRGYSNSLRVAAFIYLVVCTAPGVIGMMGALLRQS